MYMYMRLLALTFCTYNPYDIEATVVEAVLSIYIYMYIHVKYRVSNLRWVIAHNRVYNVIVCNL